MRGFVLEGGGLTAGMEDQLECDLQEEALELTGCTSRNKTKTLLLFPPRPSVGRCVCTSCATQQWLGLVFFLLHILVVSECRQLPHLITSRDRDCSNSGFHSFNKSKLKRHRLAHNARRKTSFSY